LASSEEAGGAGRGGGAASWLGGKEVLGPTGLEDRTGAGVLVLDTEVEIEEVVRCNADDRAADRDATEPITDEREVVGGRLYRCG
jgi:hypothetical protein